MTEFRCFQKIWWYKFIVRWTPLKSMKDAIKRSPTNNEFVPPDFWWYKVDERLSTHKNLVVQIHCSLDSSLSMKDAIKRSPTNNEFVPPDFLKTAKFNHFYYEKLDSQVPAELEISISFS